MALFQEYRLVPVLREEGEREQTFEREPALSADDVRAYLTSNLEQRLADVAVKIYDQIKSKIDVTTDNHIVYKNPYLVGGDIVALFVYLLTKPSTKRDQPMSRPFDALRLLKLIPKQLLKLLPPAKRKLLPKVKVVKKKKP